MGEVPLYCRHHTRPCVRSLCLEDVLHQLPRNLARRAWSIWSKHFTIRQLFGQGTQLRGLGTQPFGRGTQLFGLGTQLFGNYSVRALHFVWKMFCVNSRGSLRAFVFFFFLSLLEPRVE